MKCPICGGTGETKNIIGKHEQTNEGWFCLLPTKEKAKCFARLKNKYFWQGVNWADDEEVFGKPNIESDTQCFERWLKEVHEDE